MFKNYKRILAKPSVRYVLVGGSAYVIEVAIIVLVQRAHGTSIEAVALSYCVGLVYTFILQKFFSFGDKRTHHTVLLPQILMITALVIFNFIFTVALTALLQHTLPAIVTRTIAIGITVMWNYYLYKAHIFKTIIID